MVCCRSWGEKVAAVDIARDFHRRFALHRTARPRGTVHCEGCLGAAAHGFAADPWTLPRVAELIEKLTGVSYHAGHVWKTPSSVPSRRDACSSRRKSRRQREPRGFPSHELNSDESGLDPIECAGNGLLPETVLLLSVSGIHLRLPLPILAPVGPQVFHLLPEAHREACRICCSE